MTEGAPESRELDAELRAFLALLLNDGGLREIRALEVQRTQFPHKAPHVESGYYRPQDTEKLINAAGHFRHENERKNAPDSALPPQSEPPRGVYVSLNPIKGAALAKAPARMVAARRGESSSDSDVEKRTRLLVDIDAPREVANVSASDEEKAEAESLANEIRDYLTEQGWPAPIEVDSGNGYQLIYRIDLLVDDGGLVKRVLNGLAAAFPRDDGGVDVAVHDPARIARLPCTWNRKGFNMKDRPHRLARVQSLPDSFDIVEVEKLEQVAALAPESQAPKKQTKTTRKRAKSARIPPLVDKAVDEWNADHPIDFSTSNSPCLICGSPDGLKANAGDPSRWTCFSSRHEAHAEDGKQGAGVRGEGCFTGDALDIEAWTSRRTRLHVLKQDGYLESNEARCDSAFDDLGPPEDQSRDGNGKAREAVYYHRPEGDVPLHQLVPRAVKLLAVHAADDVYVHADRLTHVISSPQGEDLSEPLRRSSAPRIRIYPATLLRERLDGVAKWICEQQLSNGQIRAEERWCPRDIVLAIRDRGQWPGLRNLTGVTSAPVFRLDGTVLDQPGYDSATGLLYAPIHDYPTVPDQPTDDKIANALDLLKAPFADFPIVSGTDQAALLAYQLTLAARPAIRGPVPITAVTARVPGTGKTLLVDSATLAMTGHPPDKLMVPGGRSSDADAEWRKRIATLAMEGPRAVLIDNVADGGMLQSPALAAALTADVLTERLLTTNRSVRVPHRICWTLSGNNVSVASDLARRSLSIDLDARIEDPHLRSSFRIDNLMQHVREEHPRLLCAALTALRGFVVAGRPKHQGPSLGMFEDWDALIRNCVIWLTGDDPLDTQDRLRGASPETGSLGELLSTWREAIGIDKAIQARDLFAHQTVIAALTEAIPGRRELPSTKSVGQYLRRYEGRVVLGLRVQRVGTSTGTILWALQEVG